MTSADEFVRSSRVIIAVKKALQQIDKKKKQRGKHFYIKQANECFAQSKFKEAYNNVTIAIWLLHVKLPENNMLKTFRQYLA